MAWKCHKDDKTSTCVHYNDKQVMEVCDGLDASIPVVIDWNDERDEI